MRRFPGSGLLGWSLVPYGLVIGLSVYSYLDDRVGWLLYVLLMLPIALFISLRQDYEASMNQPDLFEDPLIGKEVIAIEQFKRIDGGFEGRVLINGAPWIARSTDICLVEGDKSVVIGRTGALLELDDGRKNQQD